MRFLIRLAILLVLGILVYNYFFGTQAEKETSKKIFGEVRDLGKATWDLLRSEKQKFDEGKYDEAADKIGNLLDRLRGHAETIENNKDLLARLDELERKRKELQRDIETPASFNQTEEERKKELKRESDQLMREIEELMKEMEQR